MGARGIVGAAVYLPHRRLDRERHRRRGGRGWRQGHPLGGGLRRGHDDDGRRGGPRGSGPHADDLTPDALWFSTTAPAYADKTNATAIHAALRLEPSVGAFDAVGSVRSSVGALFAALNGRGTHLVVSADLRSGLPGGPDEATFGDGAAALLVGDERRRAAARRRDRRWAAPPRSSSTAGARPATSSSKVWEERFGETRYVPLGLAAWEDALKSADLVADQVDLVAIAGTHARAVAALAKKLGVGDRQVGSDLVGAVGNLGAAQPAALLTAALERAEPGQVIALVVLADGADVVLLRATDAIAGWSPTPSTGDLAAAGAPRSTTAPTCAGGDCSPSNRRGGPSRPARRRRRRVAPATGSSASSVRPTTTVRCTSHRSRATARTSR